MFDILGHEEVGQNRVHVIFSQNELWSFYLLINTTMSRTQALARERALLDYALEASTRQTT